MELASSVIGLKQAATLQTASMAVIKKQHEMETQLINMIAKAAQSAPPPGQGTHVDKTA